MTQRPGILIGNMTQRSQTYPLTCKPEDVFLTQKSDQFNLFFNDVMVFGEYPYFIKKYYEEQNIKIDPVDNYEAILKEGTVDFISFSYYFTNVVTSEPGKTEPFENFDQAAEKSIFAGIGLGMDNRPDGPEDCFK